MPDMYRNIEFRGFLTEDVSHVPFRVHRVNGIGDGAVGQALKYDFEAGWESLVEEVKEQLRKGVASEIKDGFKRKQLPSKQANLLGFPDPAQENGFHDCKQDQSLASAESVSNTAKEDLEADRDDIDVQVLWAAAVVELAKKEVEFEHDGGEICPSTKP